ncbi:MAG: hypothetical protein AB4060_18360 [Crocosphaera sp.]
MKILDSNQSYTFSKIFELKAEADELVADFGYTFSRKRLNLPQYSGQLDRLEQLSDRITEILPNVSLSTEAARREILISPVITDLVHYTNAQLRIEYSLNVSEQLQGYLDYFLYTDRSLIIIEAKKGDLEYGFNQLAVQLIALNQWKNNQNKTNILGAVTIGNIWQFGQLLPQKKHIEQGLETYRVPEDLELLMRILVKALNT